MTGVKLLVNDWDEACCHVDLRSAVGSACDSLMFRRTWRAGDKENGAWF